MPKGVYERKEAKKEVKEAEPKVVQVGHPIVVSAPSEGGCKTCVHSSEVHYGGPTGWCNKPGCQCQSFK